MQKMIRIIIMREEDKKILDPDPTIVFGHFWGKKAKTIIVYESSVVMWSRSNLEPAPDKKKKFKLKIQD